MSAGRKRALAAFVCGLILSLTQAPLSLFWLLPVGIASLFILWTHTTSSREAFWAGWVAGLSYFGVTLFWIVEPFLVEPEKFAWLIPIALPAMAGGMALFWGAGFALAQRIRTSPSVAPLALAGCWMLGEGLRGFILTGFPWGLLGYGLIETPLIQNAAYLGINGLTLLLLVSGCLLGSLIAHKGLALRVVHGGCVVALVAGGWAAGMHRLSNPPPERDRAIQVGLVQPNVPQDQKWKPELRNLHLADLLEKTQALSQQGADVIIWPEAATPFPIAEMPDLRNTIAASLGEDSVLLTGGIRIAGRGTPNARAHNSLLAVDSKGALLGTYDKQHLVPFGEYLPFNGLLERLGLQAIAAALPGGFTAGDDQDRRIVIGDLPPFGAMVCYEAIFAHEISDRGADIDWLVHVTNDAWFGTFAGPQQHLVQVRVRAIERGIPVARAANTGISAEIDAHGKVAKFLPLNTSGILMFSLPGRYDETVYHLWEEWIFLCILMVALLLTQASKIQREK